MSDKNEYRTEPIPAMRRFALDAGYLGRKRHIVHGLIEVDITDVRDFIREHHSRTGEKLSLTAFIIVCLSRAIEEHLHVHAYRDWRNRLVIYRDINITCMFEVEFDGKKTPLPHVFRNTNHKDFRKIHDELRAVQNQPHASAESGFMRWFLHLPALLRRAFYRIA